MKKILVALLVSFSLFANNVKETIINHSLSFEGSEITKTSKRGIEYETLQRYNKKYKTNWKMSQLTHEQAHMILDKLYWDDRLNYIRPEVALVIYDFSMNSNRETAYKKIHKALGLKEQPMMSLELIQTINGLDYRVVKDKITNARISYLKSLKSFKKYGKGWLKRVNKINNIKI